MRKSRNFSNYRGSGTSYLTNVRSKAGAPGIQLTFPVSGSAELLSAGRGEALRIHPIFDGAEETLFLSEGAPPKTQRGAPGKVVFLTRHRHAKSPDKHLSSTFVTVLENMLPPQIVKAELLEHSARRSVLKLSLDNGGNLWCFDAEIPQEPFLVDGIVFSGQSGAVYLDKKGKELGRFAYGPGKTFKAAITSLDLFAETITLDREIPKEFIRSGTFFRVGRYAYLLGGGKGRTIKLLDQSMIRGRFRFELSKERNGIGKVVPPLMLARGKLGIFDADGRRYLGEATAQNRPDMLQVANPEKLHPGQDYLLSECRPGEEVIFMPTERRIP